MPADTNIVVFKLNDSISNKEFLNILESKGVLAVPFGPQLIRFVTHLNFDDDQMSELKTVLSNI